MPVPPRVAAHALHWARTVPIVEALVEAGVDVNDFDPFFGETPLHAAARHGLDDVVSSFVRAGAHIDARTREGATPLHWAVGLHHWTTAKVLLSAGADPSLRDKWGRTAYP